jgi:DNA-binding transcriptional ArsR family regulator
MAVSRGEDPGVRPADSNQGGAVHPSWVPVVSDPVRLTILRSLCELGAATTSELSAHSHTSDTTVRRHLDALATTGVLCERRGREDDITPGRPATRVALRVGARGRLAALFDLLSEPLEPDPARTPPLAADR